MTCLLRRGLLAAALLIGVPAAGHAHDPGLSALDVRLTSSRVIADLSLAAADAKGIEEPGRFVLDALVLRVDGRTFAGTVEEVAVETGKAIRVRLTYDRAFGSRLAVASAVPRRLAAGHRELLSIRHEDGSLVAERMLDARSSETVVDMAAVGAAGSAMRFFTLGVEHILGGFDHLLFLAALLVAVRDRRELVKVVTAFTVAHSLTLAAAVTGLIEVPASVVEPLIAASIVYVGVENLMRRPAGSRWRLTFLFGLIHGVGFAGALRELGIGSGGLSIAVPLGAFNLGVEAGQIALALLLLPIVWRLGQHPVLSTRLTPACSLFVVVAGGYWFVERTLAV